MPIQSFEREASVDDMVAVLRRDGALVVRAHIAAELMEGFSQAVDARLQTQQFAGEFFGSRQRLMFGLYSKGEFTELLVDPVVQGLADAILLPACNAYQVHATSCGQVWGGGTDQPLHRADDIYEPFLPYVPDGPCRILSFIWAGTDFTAHNGATRLALGSHRWPRERQATDEDLLQAVMPRGSMVVWLGGVLHGLSASSVEEPRTSLFTSFSAGWLRQEENQYITVPPEVAETLPLRAQQLLGYRVFGSALGFVDGRDGECLLREGVSINVNADPKRGGQAIANTPGPS